MHVLKKAKNFADDKKFNDNDRYDNKLINFVKKNALAAISEFNKRSGI